MASQERSAAAPPEARRRALLSVFFVLHWGAVAAYVLPATREALEPLPGWLRVPAEVVFPRAVRAVWPVARPYLELTATSQRWTLFAPDPAEWTVSVEVVPYFADPGGASWVADTLELSGPRPSGYPHFFGHRTYRILFNMGYDDWGSLYRPLFARELCRTLRDTAARPPSGLSLLAHWEPIQVPWHADGRRTYVQWMGGYDCPPEGDLVRRAPWPAYGLPDPVDTRGWPRVPTPGPAAGPGGGT